MTEGEKLHFRGIPSFSPEMFKYIENADPMKQKQLAKGIDQLMDEGVAQLFVNQFNGRKIIGTVGQLQFEVIQYRLENEYNAKCRWEPISLYKACWIESDDVEELEAFKNVSISIWQKTVMDGMSSLPTVIMFSRWLKWILSISSSTLPANSKKKKYILSSMRRENPFMEDFYSEGRFIFAIIFKIHQVCWLFLL